MSQDPYDLARAIRKALLTIVDNYDLTLEPASHHGGSRIQTSGDAPLPISADALDKRAMCRSRLASWSLLTIEERELHTERLSGLDVQAMADLLARHADWLSEHEAVADVIDELEASAGDLAGLAAPRRRDWMSLGDCPLTADADGQTTTCGGTIRAYPERDPYCERCQTVAVVSWWERAQFPDLDATPLLTGPQLVVFVHRQFGRRIGEATIRKWLERGVIQTSGQDEKGRNLYDKAGVVYAVARRSAVL